jgi:AAA domain
VNLNLLVAARALGGTLQKRTIRCPGPGHSTADRSLSVTFEDKRPADSSCIALLATIRLSAVIDMSTWDHESVPARQWAIHNRVPLRQANLFSGEGGTGKSILELTKNVAHVTGKDWLGSMPELGPAFYIGAEDEEDEIHRRLAAVAKHCGVTFKELIDGGLYVKCMLGQDATLCALLARAEKSR